MNVYNLKLGKLNGTSTIAVYIDDVLFNTYPSETVGIIPIEEGAEVRLEVTLDNGFTGFSVVVRTVGTFTASPIIFNMPNNDIIANFSFTGTFEPVNDYEPKYIFERQNINGQQFELTIFEDGYTGSPITVKEIENINFVWGGRGNDVVSSSIIPSYIDINLVAGENDYSEFLEGDNRTFKAVLKIKDSNDVFFEGYITADTITYDIDDFGYPFAIKIRAVDGLNTLNYTNAVGQVWQGFTLTGTIAKDALFGAVNQTYKDYRPLNIACEVYETRMDTSLSVFEQFRIPDAVYYRNGQEARFEDGTKILNDTLDVKNVINRIINPFVARLFLWNNEFYMIRLGDYELDIIKYFKFDSSGNFDEAFLLVQEEIDCLEDKSYNHNRAFTDFTVFLNLGELLPATFSGLFETKFPEEDWFKISVVGGELAGSYKLSRWEYFNSQPFNINLPPFSQQDNTARIQWVTEGKNALRIRNTTTTAGLSDPNLSYISRTKTNEGFDFRVQELSNKITLELNYNLVKNNNAAPDISTSANLGFMLSIEDSKYLSYNSTDNTWDWVDTETIITIPITSAVNVENTLKVSGLVPPIEGLVEFRIYKLIVTSGGTQHNYALDINSLKINFEKNDELSLGEIGVKAITEKKYSSIYDRYDIYQGDVATKQSSSAIKLLDFEVTENWTRDGVEQLPLIVICVKEIANRYGKPNFFMSGKTNVELDPLRAYEFQGKKWILTYSSYDVYKDEWNVELFSL